MEAIYARDSKGAIKLWKAEVADEDGTVGVKVIWGLLLGKKQERFYKVTPKNAGKSNATDFASQAALEVKSLWNHKKREGYKSLEDLGLTKYIAEGDTPTKTMTYYVKEGNQYTLNEAINQLLPLNNTDKEGNEKPMKCQSYYKDNGQIRIKFPCLGQPKLNGFRCIARLEKEKVGLLDMEAVKFRSKNGLEYPILTHILNQFIPEEFNLEGTELVFDGELYIHGKYLEEISSAARKYNSNTPKLEFHIFDLAIPNLDQQARIYKLNKALSETSFIRIVPTITINNDEEAQAFTDDCIAKGYEGAIFRALNAEYQFGKRPQTITKLKRYSDGEFEILDVILPEQQEAQYCVLRLRNDKNELTFDSAPEGTFDWKVKLYNNRELVIGKQATVKYFERTKDNIPFHSKVVAIRDYE